MLTSKITQIEPNGTWSNGQRTFNKFRVSFANGDTLGFLAVENFKPQVGETITYEKNEQHQTGKIHRENNFNQQKSYPASASTQTKKDDVQTYIIRQSMIKASIDFHAGQPVDLEVIKNTARELINFVNNG